MKQILSIATLLFAAVFFFACTTNPTTNTSNATSNTATTSAPATTTAKRVGKFYVRFRTEDDNKDGGDTVSGQIRKGAQVVADEDEFARREHGWDDQTDQPASNDPQFGGRAGWFLLENKPNVAITTADKGSLKLRISKTNNNGWNFRVMVLAELADGTTEEWLSSERRRIDDNARDQEYNF